MFKIPRMPKFNIPKQLFASNPMQRPSAPQPQPQPIARDQQPAQPPFFMGPFGEQIARVPQPAPQPMLPFFTGGFGQQIARVPQPAPQPQTQGPSAFAGMFGNGGFGQPLPPFTSIFGQPIARAPQPATGLAGLGTLLPNQITQLQNNMGPQTLPTNVDQELAKMSPSGTQQTAQTGPLFEQSPYVNSLGYGDTTTQNMMAGPGMGFPAAPTPGGSATGASAPPSGGLSSLGFS